MSSELNLFEIASRENYTFETGKGVLSTNDLWNLPLESKTNTPSLDSIAISLDQEIKNSASGSFVNKTGRTNQSSTTKNKLEIVKRVIEYKQEQIELAKEKQKSGAMREVILKALEQKQTESILTKSPEELQEMLKNLS